ncbi:hypothetical protein HGA88_05730 [Candidatus Roizmanbacteria bacterium]|nr:hypothetical protein [Candidatus Roizmanbacteria bacterium]
MTFSPDSNHIAYDAGEGVEFVADSEFSGSNWTKWMSIVTDTTERKKYGGTYIDANVNGTYKPTFSADGTRVTFIAVKNNDKKIIVNGDQEITNEVGEYASPQFIENSYDVAYTKTDNVYDKLIMAGKTTNLLGKLVAIDDASLFLSSNGQHTVYEYNTNATHDSYFVSIDNRSYTISGHLLNVIFSQSGNNAAYYTGGIVGDSRTNILLNGNTLGISHQNIVSGIFSPDEKYYIYSEYDGSNSSESNATIHVISVSKGTEILAIPLQGIRAMGNAKFISDSTI